MTVLLDGDQLRQQRIGSLTQAVRDLLVMRSDTTISQEDVSSKIKHHAGVIVELRDEQILKLVKLLNGIFNSYINNDTARGGEVAKVCLMLTNKNVDFRDRISYLDDPDEIAQQRLPVIKSYYALFRRKSTVRVPSIDDFSKCLDVELLRSDLDRSEFILKLPMFFSLKNNVMTFNRVNEMLLKINDAITLQNERISNLLERALTVLSRGELISFADKIDLNKAKIVSLGVTIEPFVINAINSNWYNNNLSTTLGNMADDVVQCLREPIAMIERREELTEGTFVNTMNMMAAPAFADAVRTAQTTAKSMTDKIQIISDQLTRFSDRIQTLPSRKDDGYYNHAIEDIARLISNYSGVLYHILQFVYDYAEGIRDGVDNVTLLSNNMKTHQTLVSRYMQVRGDKKWV